LEQYGYTVNETSYKKQPALNIAYKDNETETYIIIKTGDNFAINLTFKFQTFTYDELLEKLLEADANKFWEYLKKNLNAKEDKTAIAGLDNWVLTFTLDCGVYSVQISIKHDKQDKTFRLSIGGGEFQTFSTKESIVEELNTLKSVEKVYNELMRRLKLKKTWTITPNKKPMFFSIEITTRFGFKFEITYSDKSGGLLLYRIRGKIETKRSNMTCGSNTMEDVINCINGTYI
jgi:hypothetical protein